jgi:WXG100 family type VII secretion target
MGDDLTDPLDSIQLDHGDFTTTLADLRAAAARLEARRESICRDVGDLLADGWRGAAAASFGAGWEQWQHGARRVADGLAAMTDLLAAVHDDLTTRDDESGTGLAVVAARLEQRLG